MPGAALRSRVTVMTNTGQFLQELPDSCLMLNSKLLNKYINGSI
jgi:hypothetical protein